MINTDTVGANWFVVVTDLKEKKSQQCFLVAYIQEPDTKQILYYYKHCLFSRVQKVTIEVSLLPHLKPGKTWTTWCDAFWQAEMHLGQLTLLSLSVWCTWALWAALWWAGLLHRPQHEHSPNYWDINKQSPCDTVWPYGRLKGAFQGHRGMRSANSWASYTYQGERPGTSSDSRQVRLTSGLYAIYKQPQIKM